MYLKCFVYENSLLQAQCSTPLAQGCVAYSVHVSVTTGLPNIHKLQRLSNEACSHLNLALQWLGQGASLSSQFNPMPVHVEFVLDKVALRFLFKNYGFCLSVLLHQSYNHICSRVLGKLTGLPLVKKLPALNGTQSYIITFTRACHLSLSWA